MTKDVKIDTAELARRCELFKAGAKRLYDGERFKSVKGDMWFFELYHHLTDCAEALRATQEPARFNGEKAIAEFEAKHPRPNWLQGDNETIREWREGDPMPADTSSKRDAL